MKKELEARFLLSGAIRAMTEAQDKLSLGESGCRYYWIDQAKACLDAAKHRLEENER